MTTILDHWPCVLGCGWEDDELEHYVCCGVYWSFLSKPRPQGLGIAVALRGKDSAFLLSSLLNEDDTVRLAVGLYALYRTVNHYRFSGQVPTTQGVVKLLRSFCRRALEHHTSFKLLLP